MTFYCDEEKNNLKDITVLNIDAPHSVTTSFIERILLFVKTQINLNSVIVHDYNTPCCPIDRLSAQKLTETYSN